MDDSNQWTNSYRSMVIMATIKPDLPSEKRLLYEEGICLECKGDDVECTRDCSWHICLDCGYVPEKEYRVE